MTNFSASFSLHSLLVAASALACTLNGAPVLAQDAHLYTTRISGGLTVGTLEVNGGALYSSDAVDVAPELVGGVGTPFTVEWVGSEVWIGLSTGVERLTWPALQSAGQLQAGIPATAIVPTGSGATVFAAGASPEVIEYDFAGQEISRTPFISVLDAAKSPTGWFVTPSMGASRILEVDNSFQVLGRVGLGFDALAEQQDRFFFPERITRLSNGTFAVSAAVTVGVMDAAGTALSVFDPGNFETDALEVMGGELYVNAGNGSALLDPSTGAVLGLERPPVASSQTRYSSQSRDLGGTAILQRTCTTSPNSVGPGGRMHVVGTDNLALQSLTVGATGLPPGSFSLAIYGQTAFSAPYGSGTLCISPFAPGIKRSIPRPVDATGASSTPFLLPMGSGMQITAGSTWIFQVIYRDFVGGVGGFNATDSVEVTFAD